MGSETVSVVFTDLVGSTEILSRLGETRAELLRREFFSILRQGAVAHEGREVKNVGDGMMLVFPSASDAVCGAVAIQQLAEAFNRTAEVPLRIRAGGSTGDADVDDDDYFGVAVVEAARLCGCAEGGQVLVTEAMRLLARGRSGHEFASVGALELKGLDEPVPACEVLWTPFEPERSQIPLPGRFDALGSGSFVGRAAELASIHDAMKSADASGRRRVVLLSGEMGVGKTTLVAEFAREAHETGAIVLYGHCDEVASAPYKPWVECLEHLVAHATDETLAMHVDARGGDLAPLVAGLGHRRGDGPAARSDDPATARYLLYGAVIDLLDRVSAEAPVVLVLDDLHWADDTTIDLLRQVVSADRDLRVLLIGTYRDSDIDLSHPLTAALADWHREAGVERVSLSGFDDIELFALLEATAGHDLDDEGLELRDALRRETAGNPFFVTEMLRHLAERGVLAQHDDGRWYATVELRDVGLPVSVREVISHRLARLREETQRALIAAAVIGRDFDLDLLGSVTGIDEDLLLDLMDDAAAIAIVAEVSGQTGRYSFRHALTQHTLYAGLSTARRRQLHRRVGEALEATLVDSHSRASELARHWNEATRPDDVEKAYGYALLAGDRAEDKLAPGEAVRWYTQALDLVDRVEDADAERTECLVRLGTAQRLAGRPDYRETLLEAAHLAQRRSDEERLVRAALANFRGFSSRVGGMDHDRIEVLDAAIATMGPDSGATRVHLLALLAAETCFDPDRDTNAVLDEALELSARTDDADARLDALFALMTYFVPDNLEQRLACLPEIGTLAARADPGRRFWCRVGTVVTLVNAGRVDEARHLAEQLRAQASDLGDPVMVWVATLTAQMFVLLSGDLAEARRLAEAGLEIGLATGQPDAFTGSGGQLAYLSSVAGRESEGLAVLEVAVANGDDTVIIRAAHALALVRCGRGEEARAALDCFAADGADQLPRDPMWAAALHPLTEAASALGHEVLLHQLIDGLQSVRHYLICAGSAAVNGHGVLWLAIAHSALGDWEQADADFADALELAHEIAAPYFVAITQSEWAAMLLRRGDVDDRERSRELASGALESARHFGFGAVERACSGTIAALDPVAS